MKKWLPVIILGIAQFVMILDSSVMNVSISTIVKDLNTTVAGLQLAITMYLLVMAALMLTGGKMGDIWGRRKAFNIGLLVYGAGSLITAFSVGLPMLLFGWSLVEALGAILVIPAIAALVAANYKGKDRVAAYSIIAAASGVAVAAGPLIGGAVTTYSSWRYVFAAETVTVIGISLFFVKKIMDAPVTKKPTLDIWSAILSASGMFLIVFAILQSKVWGWVAPISAPVINGNTITPFGFSVVPFMIAAGVAILWVFLGRQNKLKANGNDPLLDPAVLQIGRMQSGLSNITIQYLLTAGLFFVLPVFLQMVLGLDAIQTGVKIFPLSVTLVVFSLLGARLVSRFSPKRIIVWGKWLIVLGMLSLLFAINPQLNNPVFIMGMLLVGAGVGLMASQIGNVIMSSVDETKSSEAGGLSGTFQNLGASLGTALIGSVLIGSLTTSFVTNATGPTSTLPKNVQTYITENSTKGVAVVTNQEVYNFAIQSGLSQSTAQEVSNYYLEAQTKSLKVSMLALLFLAFLGLLFSRKLPDEVIKA